MHFRPRPAVAAESAMMKRLMPSPIGHALAGVAVSWAGVPSLDRRVTLAAVSLAVLPDADLLLPGWHRTVSHSIGAVIVVTIIAAVVTGKVTRQSRARIVAVCTAAYASHLVLDWLSVDRTFPYGIQALWPFSDRFYISNWNIFGATARIGLFTAPTMLVNLKAAAQEIAILGPIVLLLWLVRTGRAASTDKSPAQISGRAVRRPPSGGAADTAGTSDRRGRRASRSGSRGRRRGR
jgi:inner membrane protein